MLSLEIIISKPRTEENIFTIYYFISDMGKLLKIKIINKNEHILESIEI